MTDEEVLKYIHESISGKVPDSVWEAELLSREVDYIQIRGRFIPQLIRDGKIREIERNNITGDSPSHYDSLTRTLTQDEIDRTNLVLDGLIKNNGRNELALCDYYQLSVNGRTNKYALQDAELKREKWNITAESALQYNVNWKTGAKVMLISKVPNDDETENTYVAPVIDVIQKKRLRIGHELDAERLSVNIHNQLKRTASKRIFQHMVSLVNHSWVKPIIITIIGGIAVLYIWFYILPMLQSTVPVREYHFQNEFPTS